jgi:TatD DNase family protein
MTTKPRTVNPFDAHAHLPLVHSNHPICLAGCFPEQWSQIEEEKSRVFRVGFGHHPWFTEKAVQFSLLHNLLQKHPYAFVGEIGLDRSPKHKDRIEYQKDIFIEQLKIARTYNRPVSIHLVRSSGLGYELIHQYYGPHVYLHGYICSVEESKRYPNAFFGCNHKMLMNPKARRLIEALPTEQILIESDETSDPKLLWMVINEIAGIKRIKEDYLLHKTHQNALRWLQVS